MSKLIKPDEIELFESARRFLKEQFRLDSLSVDKPAEPAGPQSAKAEREVLYPDLPGPGVTSGSNREFAEGSKEEAGRTVAEAEARAQQIVDEAKKKAENIFKQARKRGRIDGAEEARAEIERERRAASQMLKSFIEGMKERQEELIESLTPRLAELAAELAQKIIHREVMKDSSLIKTQAEQAIAKILQREKLIIRVSRDDEGLMKEHKEALLEMFDGVDKIEVIVDPDIERGGCIVETDLIKVDAQPRSQLRVAVETILGEEGK